MDTLQKKNNLFIPFIVAVIGSALMILTIFLPYTSATKEFAERIDSYPEAVAYSNTDIKAGDVKNVSMVQYASMYSSNSKEILHQSSVGAIYVVIVVGIGIFSLLSLIFALLKKPIPLIISDVLAFGVFTFLGWDFRDRGLMRSAYNGGIGYYLFYIGIVMALVGAVLLIMAKKKGKKQLQEN